ncbi:MAG TPA: hypothetical protein DD379_25210 [Cyanobacteria bacterium UBA11162]|nr:hypothetical protein [Cyanobacteria bacterium UBA11162]
MVASQIELTTINWNGGQRITLQNGQTATCSGLHLGQLYAIFLYNSARNDKNTPVNVIWSNSQPPETVTVPGTTANEGLASLVLVSGNDTNTVSVSITNTDAASIDCWLGSVEMPTNIQGLINQQLPANGQPQEFTKYRRYYAVPPSSWHQLTIQSNIKQFISVQFQQSKATVYIVNPTSNVEQRIIPVGSVKKDTDYFIKMAENPPQLISVNLQGNGTQWVWMNADSQQDSQEATIKLQSL